MRVSRWCRVRSRPFGLALLAVAGVAGCGGGKEQARPIAPREVQQRTPYLPRANVSGISGAAVRITPPPRAGGSRDVRGVTSASLLVGAGRVVDVTDHGVLTTTDSGRTWRRGPLAGLDGEPLAIGPELVATSVTGRACAAMRIAEDGRAPRVQRLPGCGVDALVAFADRTRALAVDSGYGCGQAGADGEPTKAYVSADGARTWQRAGAIPDGLGQASSVAVSGRLYVVAGFCEFKAGGRVGNGPTVAISRDAGRRWKGLRLPGGVLGCELSVAASSIWVLCKQVVYRSSDAGRTWRAHVFTGRDARSAPLRIAAIDDKVALATAQAGGALLRTADGGAHWKQTWPRVGPCELGIARVRPREARYRGPTAATLACHGLSRRLVPPDSNALAWRLAARTFLVTWVAAKRSGYTVWQRRDARWQRLFHRIQRTHGGASASFDDVNRDDRLDVLIQGQAGSGGCGVRDVLAVTATRVTPLFHRAHECEQSSELRDGLLRYRKAIGPCPDPDRGAHCYAGVRTIIRGWSGRRIVTNRTFVRCLHPDLDPHDRCRRR